MTLGRVVKLFFTIVFVAATIYLVAREQIFSAIWPAMGAFRFWETLLILFLFAIARIFQAFALRKSLLLFDKQISVGGAIGMVALKGFYNAGMSGAGLVAQAVRGRTHLNIAISTTAVVTALQFLLLIALLGLMFSLASIISPIQPKQKTILVFIGLLLGSTPFFATAAVVYMRSAWKGRMAQLLDDATTSLRNAMSTRPHIVAIIALALLSFQSFRIFRIVLIAWILDPSVQIATLSLTVIAADIGSVIPVTPGGIGVRELLIAAGGRITGSLELFLTAAVLDRIFALTFSLVHGLIVIVWYQFDGSSPQSQKLSE
jgi:uncharacterized membrane protein YbhN (UPF0104 family)